MRSLSHLTEACEHEANDSKGNSLWCSACEFGCSVCGNTDEVGDNSLCHRCSTERDVMLADFMHDLMKEGA